VVHKPLQNTAGPDADLEATFTNDRNLQDVAVDDRACPKEFVDCCCGLTGQPATRTRQPFAQPSLSPPVGWGGEMNTRESLWVEIKTV